jgi:hypothetical protein
MKKIFLTLSIAAMGLVKSFAQEVDLQAFVTFDSADLFSGAAFIDTVDRTNDNARDWYLGQTLTTTYAYVQQTADSFWGAVGIVNNGPDIIDAQSEIYWRSSYNRYLTAAECAAQNVPYSDTQRYAWLSGITTNQEIVDPGIIYLIGRTAAYKSDSVGMLVDWKTWVDSGRAVFVGPEFDGPFVAGKEYGFFMRIYGIGSDPSNPSNIDLDARNNFYVHKIIWKGQGLSVKDMFAKRAIEALVVYPNPAANTLKFDYEFKQNTVATMIIRDVTGRVVKSENLGRQVIGKKAFSVDVANLPNGNYVAEFQTAENTAVSKFSVAK